MTFVGGNAFSDCPTLKSITCATPEPPMTEEELANTNEYNSVYLYVPEESINYYKENTVWGKFNNIQALGTVSVKNIVEENEGFTLQHRCLTFNSERDYAVYNYTGQLLTQGYSQTINFTGAGFYIIKTGNRSFRIAIK